MVQIRQAFSTDCDVVLAVLQASFAPYRGKLAPASGVFAETAVSLREKMNGRTVLVAVAGVEIVGCVMAQPYREKAGDYYFGRLAVLPAWQRQGIATQLVNAVEEAAKSDGYRHVWLGVRIALPQNVRFFQSLGYEIVAEKAHPGFGHPTYYAMNRGIM